ncbi:MAG: EAL domain-containing protein [Burkholderiales bacterium]|nr:EAL domain-containing protein [Burkholderiales bacterium]
MAHIEKWRGKSVLIVDDSKSIRIMAAQIFESIGFAQIHEAEDGVTALNVLHRLGQVDLLITDLNMPEMDGIELLSVLTQMTPNRVGFIAVMSGVERDVLDSVQGIADASNLELLAVIPKPLHFDHFRAMLDQCDPSVHHDTRSGADLGLLREEVRAALLAGQLVPYFQPKVAIANRRLEGMEALVRWNHPVHGVLAPYHFVAHLEHDDLASDFFFYFVHQVCRVLRSLPDKQPDFYCSVNLPVPLLTRDDFVEQLQRIPIQYNLPNSAIALEVTETSLMSNLANSLGTLARLRMKGFDIAMDDYGTGYSSMKQLSRCPFTELKIDREFVHDAVNSPKKLAILTAAVSLCRKLNLTSVAEGVESEADWQQLAALGCDVVQGYFISRPIPEAALAGWIADYNRTV